MLKSVAGMSEKAVAADALSNAQLAEALMSKVWPGFSMVSEESAIVAAAIERLQVPCFPWKNLAVTVAYIFRLELVFY